MHSKKIGTVFSVGLIQRFLVRLINPASVIGHTVIWVKLFFDKTDVVTAFHAGYALAAFARETFAWHKTTACRVSTSPASEFMPAAPPPSRDVALETRVFWERFKKPIAAALLIVVVAVIVFAGYRFYSERRASAASALLASAKTVQEYQQLIARYPDAPAAAGAYLLLAEAQRGEGKFAEANTTLQTFISKYPQHGLVTTARMALAADLESLGKTDEALSTYQQIASAYPNSFNAPLALLSQVYILKAKNRNDDARRICETILTQYRTSFWAGEAMQQLRLLKPSGSPAPAPLSVTTVPPLLERPPAAAPTPATQAPPLPKKP